MRSLALTLDLDGPIDYARLHGLRVDRVDPNLMYRGPLERFVELCRTLDGKGTLFAIGRDLDGEPAERLRAAAYSEFEIASHSFTHDYHLSRWQPAAIRDDIERSCAAIERVVGASPVGFRAPGYHLSADLLDVLSALDLQYDSSVMPSPPYYAAKAAVLGGYRLLRRRSASLLGSPRTALAPRQPYRPDANPYRRGARRLIELPIAVAGKLGLPVTGASLFVAPAGLRRRMVESLLEQEVLVINLHAMDLVDPELDGLPPAFSARQPELRVPLAHRIAVLRDVLAALTAGRRIERLRDIATRCDAVL